VANRNQQSAPLGKDVSLPETVTVVDSRHPLYDQTFPLLYLTHAHHLIRCCVVQLAPDVTRLIPIAATNLAPLPPVAVPALVDLSSLQGLIATFEGIQATVQEEDHDESTGHHRPSVPGHPAAGDLGHADNRPTSGCPAAAGQLVSPTARPMESGARR
jgi:hypothetical protein